MAILQPLNNKKNLRRELIYKLVTRDVTRSHSQLVKALPRELSKSDQLQDVLAMLAVYANPSGLKQDKYSLRKAHWKELDLYHPRWISKDLQAAEERYICFCKVSTHNAQLPRWTVIVRIRIFFICRKYTLHSLIVGIGIQRCPNYHKVQPEPRSVVVQLCRRPVTYLTTPLGYIDPLVTLALLL